MRVFHVSVRIERRPYGVYARFGKTLPFLYGRGVFQRKAHHIAVGIDDEYVAALHRQFVNGTRVKRTGIPQHLPFEIGGENLAVLRAENADGFIVGMHLRYIVTAKVDPQIHFLFRYDRRNRDHRAGRYE